MNEKKLIDKIKERLDDPKFFKIIKEIIIEKAKKEIIEKKGQQEKFS